MDLKPIFESLYPEGSTGPGEGEYRGQCAVFAQRLIAIPKVGNSFAEKKKAVQDQGILVEQFSGDYQPGDVIVTNEGVNFIQDLFGKGYGHVAVVNSCIGENLRLSESNFRKDGKVTHTRMMSKYSPKIYGVFRRPYKFQLEVPKPLKPKICILMNYKKPWSNVYFEMLQEWFFHNSDRTFQPEIFPLYTSFEGVSDQTNYKAEGVAGPDNYYRYDTLSREYLKNYVLPQGFAGDNQRPDLTVLCVSKKDWKGTVFNASDGIEYGYYYKGDNVIVLAVDEGDVSAWHFGMPAIVDYLVHEVSHWLYDKALDFDLQHIGDRTHYFYQANQMGEIFKDINLKRLVVNL